MGPAIFPAASQLSWFMVKFPTQLEMQLGPAGNFEKNQLCWSQLGPAGTNCRYSQLGPTAAGPSQDQLQLVAAGNVARSQFSWFQPLLAAHPPPSVTAAWYGHNAWKCNFISRFIALWRYSFFFIDLSSERLASCTSLSASSLCRRLLQLLLQTVCSGLPRRKLQLERNV